MRQLSSHVRPLIGCILATSAVLACSAAPTSEETTEVSQQALSANKCPDDVPAVLAPAADQRLGFVLRGDGEPDEKPLLTSGDDLLAMGGFLAGRTTYAAADVIDYLLAEAAVA